MRSMEAGLRQLIHCGVTHVFGIPAGSINAFYDALMDIPEMNSVVVKHEASAGYMAAAFSRITGKPSVAVGSSGPGATNLLTACANAYTEHTPVIFLTGSVPTHILGKGGAQELPAVPLFKSITKFSRAVRIPQDVPTVLQTAYETAISGVPGPVHIEIPIDIQMSDIPLAPILHNLSIPFQMRGDPQDIAEVAQTIRASGQRGAILLGYGAKSAKCAVRGLVETLGWMVATTPRGKGAFPETHPQCLGVYGLAGHTKAIDYLHSDAFDTFVVIGSSLGESGTCNWDDRLVRGKRLIHIDYDKSVFGRSFAPFRTITGHVESIVEELQRQLGDVSETGKDSESQVAVSINPCIPEVTETLCTQHVIRRIGECAPDNARFYVDIGEMMTYAIQELTMSPASDFDINIHFGGMGSGITSAMGAQLAEPHRPVICISGDGCFFMHGMEILTAKEYQIPVLFIIINNARLGMVYHGHMLQYGRCPSSFSQTRVRLVDVARDLGIKSYEVTSLSDISKEALREWMAAREPVLIEVNVEGNEVPPMGERVKFLQGATY